MSMLLAAVSDARLYAAGAVALLYAASTAYFMRPRRTASSGSSNAGTSLVVYASQTGYAEELAVRPCSLSQPPVSRFDSFLFTT
jgi:hypothetical protein